MQPRGYELTAFGSENLHLRPCAPRVPGAGEVLIETRAISLNYRDVLVIAGHYNPRLKLPATPISDAAGVVAAVGPGVAGVRVGDRVVTHFVAAWQDGPFRDAYRDSTLGMPGPGVAASHVVLPAAAVVPIPMHLDFAEAATLPIAALTAWSALVTEGGLDPQRSNADRTVLTLGTGGVSIFVVQLAAALGARVIITSSSDAKLARAQALGAAVGINYSTQPDWEKAVLAATDGIGVDIAVETAGGTLNKSLRATRGGGIVALLGVLAGASVDLATTAVLMRRLRIAGVMVDSRAAYERMLAFIADRKIRPVIDRRYPFDALPAALADMKAGRHFGKLVVEVA